MAGKKGGTISVEDRKFILGHMNDMSAEEIAEKLNRNTLVVQRVIQTYTNMPNIVNDAVRWRLKKSNHWKQLKKAFTEDELSYIEDEYVTIVQQFQENVVATEEVQILDFVKTGVLQQRNLEAKQKIQENLNEYGRMVQAIEDAHGSNFAELSNEDRDTIMDLKNKQAACMNAESNRTVEWLNLQKEKDVLYEKIMGSREQRVKEILNTKISFTQYVKELLEKDKQEKESRFIQLYNKATTKELDRLASPYKYADGIIDNPILSAEVVEMFEERERQEGVKEEKELTEIKIEENHVAES